MKTIRETVGELLDFQALSLISALETREKERDAAEQERIHAVLARTLSEELRDEILDTIYPPPEPEKLPAGMYVVRHKTDASNWKWLIKREEPFVPESDWEYRQIEDPFAEVATKAEMPLPTAQEWIEKNVAGWQGSTVWYDAKYYKHSPYVCVPSDVFKNLCEDTDCMAAVFYSDNAKALADLKRVLIEMGLAR